MLYELFAFTGLVSIILGVIVSIILLSCVERDGLVVWPIFLISIMFYILLSNPPKITWPWIASYLFIGCIWFVFKFLFNLHKVKKYLKKYPKFWNKEKGTVNRAAYGEEPGPDHIDDDILYWYNTEPSMSKFVDRIACWPWGIIKFLFGDLIFQFYETISVYLKKFKLRFIVPE